MGELAQGNHSGRWELTMQNLKAMGTADVLKLRDEVTDELTHRLDSHLGAYLGDRDWEEETNNYFVCEDVARTIARDDRWQGAKEYGFFTCDPSTVYDEDYPRAYNKSKRWLFEQKVETPEQLAEAFYEACAMACNNGIAIARPGENVGCW